MRIALALALTAVLAAPAYADTSKPVESGLRGVRVTSIQCDRITVAGDDRVITGTVKSFRVCPPPAPVGTSSEIVALSPTKRSVAFRAMRTALVARDGVTKPGQMCAMYADLMRLVYVVTSKGTWLAHLPVDSCHHYTKAVLNALAASAPTASASPSPSSTATDPMEAAVAKTAEFAKTLIGLTEADAVAAATKAGFKTRVVSRVPGDSIPIRTDYRTDRINLTLRDGIVAKTNVG